MITAVIGANYGDEGKGLLTDFVSSPDTLVVRFNGGAQAGHTVVTPEGRRHVFHQYGSGLFRDARTLLTRYSLIDPIRFQEELNQLLTSSADAFWSRKPISLHPVLVDRDAPVVTPYDIYLNQALEQKRGTHRHGSCGFGINETVERTLQGFELTASNLPQSVVTAEKLRHIRDAYLPIRAHQLGVDVPSHVISNRLIERFLVDCLEFTRWTELVDDYAVLRANKNLVFEGAQGLLLDEDSPEFPHVTRSKTGLTNVSLLLEDAGRRDEVVNVIYVTRCYLTRHGAGPLRNEVSEHPFGWTGPETNVNNAFQGNFRYAPLNPSDLGSRIYRDIRCSELHNISVRLAVTCLDQLAGHEPFDVANAIATGTGFDLGYMGLGPTRNNVEFRCSLETLEERHR